jgi:hypothetical protein
LRAVAALKLTPPLRDRSSDADGKESVIPPHNLPLFNIPLHNPTRRPLPTKQQKVRDAESVQAKRQRTLDGVLSPRAVLPANLSPSFASKSFEFVDLTLDNDVYINHEVIYQGNSLGLSLNTSSAHSREQSLTNLAASTKRSSTFTASLLFTLPPPTLLLLHPPNDPRLTSLHLHYSLRLQPTPPDLCTRNGL